jgi:hypothetical protein
VVSSCAQRREMVTGAGGAMMLSWWSMLDDLPAGFSVPVSGHGWDDARFERRYENEAGTITDLERSFSPSR